MKRSLHPLSYLLFVLVLNLWCVTGNLLMGQPKEIPINDLVQVINNSIEKTAEDLENAGVVIKTAKIKLSTARDRLGGGGFKIIVKGNKTWSQEHASSITYIFEKPMHIAGEKGKKNLSKDLVTALTEASNSFAVLRKIEGLSKKGFEVTVSFTVSRKTGGGIEFEVFGVGVEGSVGAENTASHSITLSFS